MVFKEMRQHTIRQAVVMICDKCKERGSAGEKGRQRHLTFLGVRQEDILKKGVFKLGPKR